jgi:signal transduction histidine kinase
LVAVDPTNVRTNSIPPAVVIEKLFGDDRLVSGHGATPLKIAPGRHRYEFEFTGLSFTAPEKVRFRYQLQGLDQSWIETQSPRKAYYSHIPPGRYQFHVQACNNDGVWNETGASMALTVLPAFWQTWWFRVFGGGLTAVGGGGIAWVYARRKMRRKLESLQRQQAIERERSRIARDIHDDLGAGLTRISLLSESIPSDQIQPPQAGEMLGRIFTTTRELTLAMDEIVWAVNPQHDTLDSLANYLGKYAQDFLEYAGVRCRLDIPMQLPRWHVDAEVRHNLFLAFKEALNNVLRHAHASEVRVSLKTSPDDFTIKIEDDGMGFADTLGGVSAQASDRRAGRNGLDNMKRRLRHIGGTCLIQSAVARGTSVEFGVPRNAGPT